MKRVWLCAAAAAAMLGAAAPAFAEDPIAAPRYGTWGYDLSARHLATRPGDDFYRYSQGDATDRLTIPADRSVFGNFDTLATLSEGRVRAVLEAAAKEPKGEQAKIGAYYRAYMDEARAEKLGGRPMKADLATVKAVRTHADLARLQGATTSNFGAAFFDIGIFPDLKAPGRYAIYLSQNGLSLPNRDFYLDAKFADKKTAFAAYVERMLTLAGWPDPAANAKAIVALETKVAEVSWRRADQSDPDKIYNPAAIAELEALAPGYPWKAYLDGAGLPDAPRVVVSEASAFPKIADIYAATPIETLKAWQAFTIADAAAPYLSARFVDAHFDFRSRTLSGIPEQKARWRRAVSATNKALGEAVGEQYVARYFPPESKAKMLALVGDLKTAMRGRIERLDWMSPETKAKALEKLAKFKVKIAYPDTWRDYSALTVSPRDLYGNVERAAAFEWRRQVERRDKPVDREEWGMAPQTVNAYYHPTNVEIVFPAAILQPPFFDPDADPAVNYGGIGGVIGHEITHGFDDDGRKLDGDGMLTNWWTEADLARFTAETQRLGAQYSAMEPLPGSKIDGELTMGENIADLGGLLLALDAYRASLKGAPAPVIDGLTGEQRVLLGWTQVWRGKYRDDALRERLVTDSHSPNTARVNGPVRNIDAWYEAFGVTPENELYLKPEDRVRIW